MRAGRPGARRGGVLFALAGLAVVATLAPGTLAGSVVGHDAAAPDSAPPFVGVPSTECPAPLAGAQFYAPSARGAPKTVALTFDDGPGPSTQAILDILERFHVRATFMNIGDQEEERPSLVQEEVRDGFLVGDHTMTHPDLESVGESQRAGEVDGVVHLDRRLAATSPCVFRPPYGDYDDDVLSLVNSRRMTLWMWSVDTEDWKAEGSGSAYWIDRIVSLAESEGGVLDHPVVLMHNQAIAMPATVAALPRVIQFFQAHGYVFVDLLGRTGPPGSCGTGPDPRVAGVALGAGRQLASGSTLRSQNGEFALTMEHDGDLVVHVGTRVLWRSRTSGHAGARLVVTDDGDVQVVAKDGTVVFSTGTGGHRGARLVLGTNGALAVELGALTLWSDGAVDASLLATDRLAAGWELSSPNGKCRLIQQRTGNLVLDDEHGDVLWQSATSGAGGFSVLTTGGDLQVRSGTGAIEWRSETSGHGLRLAVLDSGQIVVTAPGGNRRWLTP